MGIFSNNYAPLDFSPLDAAPETAPWFNATGVIGGKETTSFLVKGLPIDGHDARNPAAWRSLNNATVEGGGMQFEISFAHAADGEAAGQRPCLTLIRDNQTLFEVALDDGNMYLNKGSGSENRMASFDMDIGFTKNKFMLVNDGSKKPCLSISSAGLSAGGEYKLSDGTVIATLVSPTELEVTPGSDVLKVLALFMLQWWHHINEMCTCRGRAIVPGLV